jgi:hypothetical protein
MKQQGLPLRKVNICENISIALRVLKTETKTTKHYGSSHLGYSKEKERVKVVNKNPYNLLVSWIPGGITLTEILKANMTR